MSNYIQFYTDSACTQIWKTVPCDPIVFTSIGGHGGQPGILTAGGKTYNYYDSALPALFYDTEEIHSNPFLTFNRPEETRTVYCKNGFSMRIGSDSNRTVFSDFKYNGESLPFDDESAATGRYWAIVFFDTTTMKNYVGFTRQTGTTWEQYIPPIACIEIDFWNSAFRPAYDYGNNPDGEGGQGNGNIDGTGVHTSPTPSGHVPTGGRGLHIYRISQAGYNSVQDYLWGEGSTLAKTLWQKFMNHNHNPANCICGCFQLPQIFMPPRGSASGVQLGGVNLPTTGTFAAPHMYIDTEVYSLGTISPPFGSWLDYAGVTCKIAVPFCGEIPVPVEKVWNKNVTVQYRCDTFNGNFSAIIKAGGDMIANVTGNAAYQIPIVAGDDGTLQRIGAAAAGVLGIVTAGSSAAAMTAAGTAAAGIAGAQYNTYCANSNTSGNAQSCINGVAYIEYIVPQTAKINSGTYNGAYGMPSCVSGTLSEFTGGYGEFDVSVQEVASVWNATPEEKDEIVKLLEGGVFV